MLTPVGVLMKDAETKALKKAARTHTSSSECGCQVTVTVMGSGSGCQAITIDRCTEHAIPRGPRR